MKIKGKKFISLFIVFSIGALSGILMAKERRGADLIVQKKDGQQIRGELIAVKRNSLLLIDSVSASDVSVGIRNIEVIKIVKKSKILKGAGYGLLIGGAGGVLLGFILHEIDDELAWLTTAREAAWHSGTLFGITGLSIGAIGGTIAGKDKTIQMEGRPQDEIERVLNKLRSKARIPDFQ